MGLIQSYFIPDHDAIHENLLLACERGDVATVQKTLSSVETPIDLNYMSDGWSLLHYAVIEGRLEIVKMLVDAGAEMTLRNEDQSTILMLSIVSENLALIKFLLRFDAVVECVNAQNREGTSALHLASLMGQKQAVKLLLSKGAKDEIRDEHNKRPSQLARTESLKCIIEEVCESEHLREEEELEAAMKTTNANDVKLSTF